MSVFAILPILKINAIVWFTKCKQAINPYSVEPFSEKVGISFTLLYTICRSLSSLMVLHG